METAFFYQLEVSDKNMNILGLECMVTIGVVRSMRKNKVMHLNLNLTLKKNYLRILQPVTMGVRCVLLCVRTNNVLYYDVSENDVCLYW